MRAREQLAIALFTAGADEQVTPGEGEPAHEHSALQAAEHMAEHVLSASGVAAMASRRAEG